MADKSQQNWNDALNDFERFSSVFELSESAKSILRLCTLLVDIQYRIEQERIAEVDENAE